MRDKTKLSLRAISPELQKRFGDACYQTYNNVSYDAWGHRVPMIVEYLQVVLDHIYIQGDLTSDEKRIWDQLSYNGKVTIARRVGP